MSSPEARTRVGTELHKNHVVDPTETSLEVEAGAEARGSGTGIGTIDSIGAGTIGNIGIRTIDNIEVGMIDISLTRGIRETIGTVATTTIADAITKTDGKIDKIDKTGKIDTIALTGGRAGIGMTIATNRIDP